MSAGALVLVGLVLLVIGLVTTLKFLIWVGCIVAIVGICLLLVWRRGRVRGGGPYV